MRALTRAAVLVATLLPSLLLGQGVVVQSSADLRLYGALGAVVGFAARMGGGNMHDIRTTTSVVGHKMRTESGNTATIIDVDAGRITNLDLKQKTYTSMTFEEMAAQLQRAAEEAKKERAQEGGSANSNDSLKLKYNVSVDRTGQHEKIAGYDAERVFITITMSAEAKPEGAKTEEVGSFVFLLDQWMSKDAPQAAAMEEFQRAYAKKVGRAFLPPMEALQAAFTSDPRIKEGFEASAKELQKVSGVALRNTTYAVTVPPNMKFDRQLALTGAASAATADNGKKEEKKRGGFRGFMGALKSAAEEASKSQSADSTEAKPAKQSTLLSVTDEVKSVTPGAVAADAFTVPAGFREVKPKNGAR